MPRGSMTPEDLSFKIPLAGVYNTRIQTPFALSSTSGIVGIGIVGVMVVGLSSGVASKDQRFINCYSETVYNPFTDKKSFYLVKRPGFASSTTPQSGSIGNEVMIWTGNSNKVISAFGATNSSIYDGTTQLVTNNGDNTVITGKARRISETFVGTTATLAIASTDNTAWYYQPAGTVTKITDADFPGNNSLTTVGGFVHMNGYTFIMDSLGQIWNSDLNSITSWNALGFIQTDSYPDAGIGLIRKNDKLMAFGKESIQFFQGADTIAPAPPLIRIEPLTLRIGCVGSDAIVSVEDSVYWAGSSSRGSVSIYEYSDQLKKISPPEIDKVLTILGNTNISLSSVRFYGRTFVIVSASATTFVYCVEEQTWHEWTSPLTEAWFRCVGLGGGTSQLTYSISKINTTGKVFVINPASFAYRDNSLTYTATVQTSKLGEGNRRTVWNEIELIGDTSPVSSPVIVSYSDDDYQTFTVLCTLDMADTRPRFSPAGSSYRRAWLLTHEANTPLRLEYLAGRQYVGDN